MTPTTERHERAEPKWGFVAYAVGLGVVTSGAALVGDRRDVAILAVPLFALLGVAMAFTPYGRLRDRSKDERETAIDREAAVFSYGIVAAVVGVGYLWSLATGQPSGVFALVGFVAGTSYLGALAVLSRRR